MPAPNSARKSIVIGVVGFSVLLVAVGVFLPSSEQRQIQGLSRKLIGLVRATPPPLPSAPAIEMQWYQGFSERPKRDVTLHAYLELGTRTSRADLLRPMYATSGRGRSVFHLAFDPKREDEVRLATALALAADPEDSRGNFLRHNAFLSRGPSTASVRKVVNQLFKKVGPVRIAVVRKRILAELADGSATAYPVGTVLYEADGKFYREPKPSGPVAGPYSGISTGYSEAVEALGDARVPLP